MGRLIGIGAGQGVGGRAPWAAHVAPADYYSLEKLLRDNHMTSMQAFIS